MNLFLGHPPRWLDVAAAVVEMESKYECVVTWEINTIWDVNEPVIVLGECRMVFLLAGRFARRNPIMRHGRAKIEKGFNICTLLYKLLWECACTGAVVLPLSEGGKEGPAATSGDHT